MLKRINRGRWLRSQQKHFANVDNQRKYLAPISDPNFGNARGTSSTPPIPNILPPKIVQQYGPFKGLRVYFAGSANRVSFNCLNEDQNLVDIGSLHIMQPPPRIAILTNLGSDLNPFTYSHFVYQIDKTST